MRLPKFYMRFEMQEAIVIIFYLSLSVDRILYIYSISIYRARDHHRAHQDDTHTVQSKDSDQSKTNERRRRQIFFFDISDILERRLTLQSANFVLHSARQNNCVTNNGSLVDRFHLESLLQQTCKQINKAKNKKSNQIIIIIDDVY